MNEHFEVDKMLIPNDAFQLLLNVIIITIEKQMEGENTLFI